MRIWLVHGFNVRDGGRGTVDQLIPFLKKDGHEVLQFDYGWTFLLGARFGNKGRAKKLAKLVQPGDVLIAHSNGCTIGHRTCNLLPLVPFSIVIYIAPALDPNLVPQWGRVKKLVVYFSPDDSVVKKARWFPLVIWGDMGARGCNVKHAKVKNFNKSRLLGTEVGHSKQFEPRFCEKFYKHLREQFK